MSSSSKPVNKVVLVSIDGWGLTDKVKGNAIHAAATPNMDRLSEKELFCRLDASGLSVGLPRGNMGNSEVGHLTMGCGRVQFQDLVRINESVADASFAKNETLVDALNKAKNGTGRIHFAGLVSDGGVHSHIDHLFAFLDAARQYGVPNSYVHFFADGRDTPPTSATKYVKQLQDFLANAKYGKIGSVMGRYYAMDRDKRWERIDIALQSLFENKGESSSNDTLIQTIEKRYAAGENDEFLKPIIVDEESKIRDGDTVVFIDYRSDRMREIVQAFAYEPPYETKVQKAKDLNVFIMTKYDEKFKLPIIFPPQNMDNVLAEWLAKENIRQFHTAETEKYAHVTFFFNGGREEAFPLEDRGLIPSPKVPTYDHQPEMSQIAVAESVVTAVEKGVYPFIMCNFAAPDMVGHTGMYDKAVIACAECDKAIGLIAASCEKNGYTLMITADHGNAEEMEDENGNPKTSHTTNLIPLIIQPAKGVPIQWVDAVHEANKKKVEAGGLAAVAPSILSIMDLPIPKEMTGKPLVQLVKQ